MTIRRTRKIYKTPNNLSHGMKILFRLLVTNRVQREGCKFNLQIWRSNQVTFSIRSLHTQGPKVRNYFPVILK